MASPQFSYVDERTIRDADGVDHDVLKAIDALEWVPQTCPFMPHDYAYLQKSPPDPWFVVEAAIKLSPNSFRAYFRGYPTPNRYWEAPDGLRYWRTFSLNRCKPDPNVELRRVDQGAKPAVGWIGPKWAPNGIGYYTTENGRTWWPHFEGTEYTPCRSCTRKPRSAIDVPN